MVFGNSPLSNPLLLLLTTELGSASRCQSEATMEIIMLHLPPQMKGSFPILLTDPGEKWLVRMNDSKYGPGLFALNPMASRVKGSVGESLCFVVAY